jgi:hypothetical protein
MNYLTSNAKMKRDGILAFGIPAYRAESGKLTCPAAKDCLKGCYAKQGFYVMPNVRRAQEARLALAMSEDFIATMNAEITRRKPKIVRIHDSGDFFSLVYLRKWCHIARANKGTQFYAYTKMVAMFKHPMCPELPANLKIVFSYGGKYDAMIDREKDAHSVIFDSVEALNAAGYVDCHERDFTYKPEVKKVGLVYHGFNSKAFTAGAA